MTSAAGKKPLTAGRIAKAVLFRTLRVCTIFAVALAGGFLVFAHTVSIMPAASPPGQADGIVALTGDEERISEAVRLLAEGRGSRLLISGVNKTTYAPQIISMNTGVREEAGLFRCCIDLGKHALNTEDNAYETTAWARSRGFHSLIVVTSTYHMPRALIELRQSMPEVELVPYPVKSPRMETEWWTDSRTAWVLCKEYLKFVTVSVRFAANRMTGALQKTESHARTRTINARMD